MSQASDVSIIGGGVIGLTTAYFLAKQGASVEVFDKAELGAEASWAGAGIIPPGNFARASAPIDRLRALSVSLFPSLSVELRELTGIDVGYRICGGLEFFDEDAPPLDAWRNEGIAFEQVAAEAIGRFEPNAVSIASKGYFFEGMAQIRNPRFLRALIAACEAIGVRLRPRTRLESIGIQGNRVSEIRLENGEKCIAGCCLLAAGAWSNPLLAAFRQNPAIHPVRGQMVLLRTEYPLLRRIIMVGKRYLVPREDGRVLIGATEEPEAGFVKRTTAQGVSSLLAFAAERVPALNTAEVEKCWAGLRPGSRDGMPYLGAIPGFENAFVATGHFRSGIQLAPGTAQVMSEVMLGNTPSIPLDFFRLDREPDRQTVAAFRS